MKIIKTKEDFKCTLEITPKLTVKQYVEICNKCERIDFLFARFGLKELERKIGKCFLYINFTGNIFSDYKLDHKGLGNEVISVEDFLREEPKEETLPIYENVRNIKLQVIPNNIDRRPKTSSLIDFILVLCLCLIVSLIIILIMNK